LLFTWMQHLLELLNVSFVMQLLLHVWTRPLQAARWGPMQHVSGPCECVLSSAALPACVDAAIARCAGVMLRPCCALGHTCRLTTLMLCAACRMHVSQHWTDAVRQTVLSQNTCNCAICASGPCRWCSSWTVRSTATLTASSLTQHPRATRCAC
jgi:hypothetical protein